MCVWVCVGVCVCVCFAFVFVLFCFFLKQFVYLIKLFHLVTEVPLGVIHTQD